MRAGSAAPPAPPSPPSPAPSGVVAQRERRARAAGASGGGERCTTADGGYLSVWLMGNDRLQDGVSRTGFGVRRGYSGLLELDPSPPVLGVSRTTGDQRQVAGRGLEDRLRGRLRGSSRPEKPRRIQAHPLYSLPSPSHSSHPLYSLPSSSHSDTLFSLAYRGAGVVYASRPVAHGRMDASV
jgi:hypothetical protein